MTGGSEEIDLSGRERVTDVDFIQEIADILDFKGEVFLREPLIPSAVVDRNMGEESDIRVDINKGLWPDIREAYNDEGFRSTFAHEMVHVVQEREEIRAGYSPERVKEREDGMGYVPTAKSFNLSFLDEGQATALAGNDKHEGYRGSSEAYRKVIDWVQEGRNFGEVLEELNDEMYLAIIDLGDYTYHLALEHQEVSDMGEAEIYNRFVDSDEAEYLPFEATNFWKVDISDDAETRGRVLERTHERIAKAYQEAYDRGNELLVEQLDGEILEPYMG